MTKCHVSINPASRSPQLIKTSTRPQNNHSALLSQNKTAYTDFPNVVAQRHIFGVYIQRGYELQFWTRPRFLYNAPTPKFHHPMFTRSEVIMLTNKQTDATENIQRSSLRYDVG